MYNTRPNDVTPGGFGGRGGGLFFGYRVFSESDGERRREAEVKARPGPGKRTRRVE